ncbi:AAT family amino acid transporter [Aspergillus varians]
MASKLDNKTVDRSTDDASSIEAGSVVGEVQYAGEQASAPPQQLHRNFKARHIQMIGLAGSIGSGLFVGTGKALRYGNYPGLYIGWSLICAQQWVNMQVMSEAAVIFPTSGAFIDHAAGFVDPSLAFALGACEWFAYHTTLAAEGSIFRLVLTYWTDAVPTAACMTFYLVLIFCIHSLPNRYFAEFEFATALLKIAVMAILIISCIVMLAGGGPTGSTDHLQNFKELPAFPNGFAGIAECFLLASFSCGGGEYLGILNGESKTPRWNLPRAVNNLGARLFLFFGSTVIFISLLVPYNDKRLLGVSNAASSPFVIALNDAGIKGLPDLVNIIIIIGLCALGAEALFVTSRLSTAMARMGMFPKAFGRVDKKGRPYVSLIFSAMLATTLTYINCSNTGGIIFTWFSSVGSTVYFLAYLVIAVTNWRMHAAFKAQGDNPLSLQYAYRNKLWPLGSVFLFASGLFVIGTTFYISLFPIDEDISVENFFQTFLCVPLFLVLWAGYKIIFRTKMVDPAKADLVSGRRPLVAEDIAFFDIYYSQPLWKRALTYISV